MHIGLATQWCFTNNMMFYTSCSLLLNTVTSNELYTKCKTVISFMFQDTKQFKKLEKFVLKKLYFIKLLFETGYILKTVYLSSIFNYKIYN